MARDPDLSQVILRDKYLELNSDTAFGLGEWKRYDSGIWAPIPEQVIKREIQAVAEVTIREGLGAQLSSGLINSVYTLLTARTFVPDERFDANPDVLTFNDCCLQLSTRKIYEHDPRHYATLKLPYNYDPSLREPVWDEFLASLPSDSIEFLTEFMGLCVTPWTKYEIALWLHGPAGAGKSTFVEGMQAMLGPKSCILGLGDIDSKFGLNNLPGTTLAISTEQPSAFASSVNRINQIISGEHLNIDRKYMPVITIKPQAKIIWAMNDLPTVDGSAVGLFRRVKIVYFPAITGQLNPKIKETIAVSGMAIMNSALAGLTRLEQRGHFVVPKTVERASELYRVTNDISQLFLLECCELVADARIKASELFTAYRKWCKATNHHASSMTKFGRDMERLGVKKAGKSSIIYRSGVRLREEGELEVEEQTDSILEDYGAGIVLDS